MPTRSKISNNVIFDLDRLEEEVAYFSEQDAFAFDLEAQGLHRGQPTLCDVTWISLATYGRTIVVPLGHPIGDKLLGERKVPYTGSTGKLQHRTIPIWEEAPEQLLKAQAMPVLKPLFMNDALKIAHNATYDLCGIAKYIDGPPAPPYTDTIVLQWLLDENLKSKGLKDRIKDTYGVTYDTESVGRCVEKHPFSKVAKYSLRDASFTWLLFRKNWPKLCKSDLEPILDLENEVLEAMVHARLRGVPIDVALVEALEGEFAERLVEMEADIYRAAGSTFNIRSSQQKAKILYGPIADGGQGLKAAKKSKKTGAESTDAESLKPHATNPVVKAMSAFSVVDKLQGTYVQAWLGHTKDEDRPPQLINGWIHTDLVQYGTHTGRFSSRDPNLQNIPARTAEGKRLRECFIAPPGFKLIVADWDQIELRILAHFAGDGRLWQAFFNGDDPHSATAAALYRVAIEEVTKAQRNGGKGINFATIYGAMAPTLSANYGIPLKMAEKFLKEYPEVFPEIAHFKKEVLKVCKSRRPPHVKTILGRKRRLPEIFARENWIREKAERQAVNAVVQGSNADLCKLAMAAEHRMSPRIKGFQLALTVHDELVSLCPEDRVEDGVELVREAMLGEHIQNLLRVPVTADIKVVDRWSDAK